jgi:RimJ/RimL family protein N-acetyltransferase
VRLFRRRSERTFTIHNGRSADLLLWIEPWAEEYAAPPGGRIDLRVVGAGASDAEAPLELSDHNLCFYAPGGTRVEVLLDGVSQQSASAELAVPQSGRLSTRDFVGLVFTNVPETRPGGAHLEQTAMAPALLGLPMQDGEVQVVALSEAHREPLRAVCAEDPEVWQIYPMSFFGEHFDRSFDACFGNPNVLGFAIFDGERLVGMSSYFTDAANKAVEIGRTYVSPQVRGSGFNSRVKRLMLDRAFGEGFTRVQFQIDTRNARSMAAVEKLGAVREGTLRKNRITWTGFVRDTAVYSILADEWRARE